MTLKKLAYAALAAAAAAAFVLGTPATGQAKAASKAEVPDPPACLFWHKKVCGLKGGHKFTYESPCFAAKDGAKVIAQRACK